MIYVCEL